jgi:hypothetical protein
MAVIETISLSGIGATRDLTLPARHKLTVQNGPFECPLFRLHDVGVVKRNLMIDADETFTIVSPRETKWRVGPVSAYATIKIETVD